MKVVDDVSKAATKTKLRNNLTSIVRCLDSYRKSPPLSPTPSNGNSQQNSLVSSEPWSADHAFLEAQKRLRASLEGLEVAISRHNERAMEQADQAAEFSALQEDRSRLAQQLDAAMTRMRALETAHGEAARRVERASAAVRAVIAADMSGER